MSRYLPNFQGITSSFQKVFSINLYVFGKLENILKILIMEN